MMMRLLPILTLAVLVGCAQEVETPTAEVSLLRNPTAQVGSQADVSAADLAGDWFVRQAGGNRWTTFEDKVTFGTEGNTLILPPAGFECDQFGLCHGSDAALTFVPVVLGRWRVTDPEQAILSGASNELWVYWMDFDDRTVAIGDPNGNFVVILDRAATGGTDRIAAARDILDWYGYDLGRLKQINP